GQAEKPQAHTLMDAFYKKFVSGASVSEMGLMVRHFRLKKCYNDEYTRVQFSIADQMCIPQTESSVEICHSKLEIEQATLQLMETMGGKAKFGAAPQGHLESLAQKLIDKTKASKSTGARGSKGGGRR
ncbi:unnamed protein product, partial [Prorocentrum cordatum]